MKWQEFIQDYLTFSRKDRIGIIVIIVLLLLVAFAPKFIGSGRNQKSPDVDTIWGNAIKKLEKKETGNYSDNIPGQYNDQDNNNDIYQFDHAEANNGIQKKKELFYFDPNTLDFEGWQKLNLKPRTILTIQNYLNKGGHFKQPEDLLKIYGLNANEYKRLLPYIRIKSDNISENNKEDISNKIQNVTQKVKDINSRYKIIDINTSDTTDFISLPGIGSKLATRIISFRNKLGGFYSIDQAGETFGLPDSTFKKIKQYLKLENYLLKKININNATIDELKSHPYIRWSLANPIIAYRNEHGAFTRIEDIKKITIVSEELFNKIAPYLTTE